MATTTMLHQHIWSSAGIHGMKDNGQWIPATSPFALGLISCLVTGHYTWSLPFSGEDSPGSES